MAFDDYDYDRLFTLIYSKVINLFNLPLDMFIRTKDELIKGLYEGLITYDGVDEILRNELSQNIYLFSGAKTFQTIKDIQSVMVEDGKIISLSKFKKAAKERFDIYNKNYLETEYNTSVGQGQMVSKWTDITNKKDTFPYLEYSAVMDTRTSDICEHLDGIIRKVDDQFWKTYSPLNHFNCRCEIHQLSKYDEFEVTKIKTVREQSKLADNNMSDIFKMNPYYEKVVFSKKHPYFDVPKTYKEWAKKNFGLPTK